jgi:DNA-binding transcriptional LysR family regulator
MINKVTNTGLITWRNKLQRKFDDLQLGTLELFCLVAEVGSFSAAAVSSGITPAAVSRSIARLEDRLGVRLFVRSTRHIHLTDAGKSYAEQCREAIALIDNAERQIQGQQLEPAGLLRISIPTPYAHFRLLPVLAAFSQRYPKIQLALNLNNYNVDLTDGTHDLAIRGYHPADSNLIARKLEDAELVVVAAPAYLAQAGEPTQPEDLAQHNCIQFELPSTGKSAPWTLKHNNKSIDVTTRGNVSCNGDFLGGLTLAKHGMGIFQTYRFTVADLLTSGELVEVLTEYGGTTRPFIMVYPHQRHKSLALRSLMDFLVATLQPVSH